MKYLLSLLLLAGSFSYTYAQLKADEVSKMVRLAVDSVHFAGATVLVAQGDKILHHQGYGLAHVGFKVPAGTDTRYFGAGVSNIILSAVTLKMMETGKVSLDKRIREYLPELPVTYDSVTVKHLITSTSGIPDYHYLGDRYDGQLGQPKNPDEVLLQFTDLALTFSPGTRFEWSVSNFLILTLILEKVSGKPYDEILREFISPLQLKSTGIHQPNTPVDNLVPCYQFKNGQEGFFTPNQTIYSYDRATSLYTTVGDLFEIWKGIKNGKLIRKESFAQMISREEAKKNNSGNFGYMVSLIARDGKEMVHMGGTLAGRSSILKYLPADDITIIVLCNTGVMQEADHIAEKITRNFFNHPPFPIKPPKEPDLTSLPVSPDSMQALTGTYVLNRRSKTGAALSAAMKRYQRTIRVFVENNRLMVQHSGEMPVPLLKQNNGMYYIYRSLPETALRFVQENGKVTGVAKEYLGTPFEDAGDRVGDGDARTFQQTWMKSLAIF